MSPLEQVAYELSSDALAQQRSAMDELRARTGTLLTASSLVASFLGAQVVDRHGLNAWVVAAMAAFASSAVLCVYVLLPKRGLVFSLGDTYDALYELRLDEAQVYRRLAGWLQAFRSANEAQLRRMTDAFQLAGFVLVAEIVLLALGLGVD